MTEPTSFDPFKILYKIEFHETKEAGYIRAGIETRFYIKSSPYLSLTEPNNLHDFLKYCDDIKSWNGNYKEEEFKYQYEKAMRSKRDNPHFHFSVNGMNCEVYPKQSYIAVYEVNLHYICQHSFDIFPNQVKELFYAHDPRGKPIGKLYPIKRCKLENCGQHSDYFVVKNSDILSGFMQSREENEKYHDSFVEWIKHRRFIEVK
jgi:hypothetical protein